MFLERFLKITNQIPIYLEDQQCNIKCLSNLYRKEGKMASGISSLFKKLLSLKPTQQPNSHQKIFCSSVIISVQSMMNRSREPQKYFEQLNIEKTLNLKQMISLYFKNNMYDCLIYPFYFMCTERTFKKNFCSHKKSLDSITHEFFILASVA